MNIILLAGASGSLGTRILEHLLLRNARVRVLVRSPEAMRKLDGYAVRGAEILVVDFNDTKALHAACADVACVVSALSGLREVIVDAQTRLLEAAVAAGVPRFIPSDFSIDFTRLPEGSNRNLDLRREFYRRIEQAPIRATSILNGMFMELLRGQAPVILFPVRRVLYWGDADQLLDFTTMENTAEFTAAAAMDPDTTRFLRIAGDVSSARGLAAIAGAVMGKKFRLLRPGGLKAFGWMIRFTRLVAPAKDDVFPAWQGMQYMHNMFSGAPKLQPLDNDRYPEIRWTPVAEVIDQTGG